jgi:sugar phosphate permease
VFASTWLSYVGFYFARKPFSIVKSDLGKALSFDAQDLSFIYAAYLIAYTLGQFVSGALGPRFGARLMLLCGMGVSLLTAVAFGFAAQMPWFIALMILNGFAQATGWSNNVGCMAAWFHRGERGTVMGFWATCFQVGNIAAPAFAAWTLAHYGFRYAFFTGAVVLAAVWVFFVFNQANRPEDKGLPAVKDPDARPGESASGPDAGGRWSRSTWVTVILVGGAYFGMKFIRYAIDSWAPFFLSRNFDLKGDDAGYISTLFGICGVVGVIASGWWSDRFFHGRRALISFVMIVGVVAATTFMATAGTRSAASFAVAISLIGFTLYGPDALMTGAGAMDIGNESGAIRAAGIISGLGSAGSVVQELLIGHLYKQNGGAMAPVLATLFGSALLSAGCLGAIVWRNRRGTSDV